MFDIHIEHLHLTVDIPASVVAQLVEAINSAKETVMDELETLTTEVAETRGVMESAKVLIEGFSARLTAALGNPAALKALADDLNTNTNSLAAAIAANPLPSDPPAEPPTPTV